MVPLRRESGTWELGKNKTLKGRSLFESKKKRLVSSHCEKPRNVGSVLSGAYEVGIEGQTWWRDPIRVDKSMSQSPSVLVRR